MSISFADDFGCDLWREEEFFGNVDGSRSVDEGFLAS